MKKICSYLSVMLVALLICFAAIRPIQAAKNYQIIVNDYEDLLTDQEETNLKEKMAEIAEYGNVAFVSASQYDDTAKYAKSTYRSYFGTDSGLLFLIDMGRRNIWIFKKEKNTNQQVKKLNTKPCIIIWQFALRIRTSYCYEP